MRISYVVSGNGEDRLSFIVFEESKFVPKENSNKKWASKPKF